MADIARRAAGDRKLAFLMGFACLAWLGGVTVLYWPELQEARYLERLRREPRFFQEALSSSHRLLREACRQFVRELEGGGELVTAFIREVDSGATWSDGSRRSRVMDPFYWDHPEQMALGLRKELPGHGVYECQPHWLGPWWVFSLIDGPEAAERRDFILELLPTCAGKTYQIAWPVGCPSSEGCPDIYVHVASTASIRAATAEADGDDAEYLRRHEWPEFHGLAGLPRGVEHVCLVRMGPDNPGISLELTPSGPAAPFQELKLDVTPFAPAGSPR